MGLGTLKFLKEYQFTFFPEYKNNTSYSKFTIINQEHLQKYKEEIKVTCYLATQGDKY